MKKQPGYGNIRGTTGAVSAHPVPATVNRTLPKATALGKLFDTAKAGAAAAARSTPLGRAVTVCSLVCPFLNSKGYSYDEEQGGFYNSNYTHVLELKVNMEEKRQWVTIAQFPLSSITDRKAVFQLYKSQMDAACAGDTVSTGGRLWRERGYSLSSALPGHRSCMAEKNGDVRFWGIIDIRELGKGGTLLTEERFIELIQPLVDADPGKYLDNLDFDESDYTETAVVIPDGTMAQSLPYTNPQTEQAEQAQWQAVTVPNPSSAGGYQTSIVESITLRPDLTPYSPAAPAAVPQNGTGGAEEAGSGSGTSEGQQERQQADTESLCEKHPDILACDKQPESPQASAPDLAVPVEEIPVVFEPDGIFPDSGICPAPVSFDISIGSRSRTFSFEYTHVCDLAFRLRGVLIAFAWLLVAVLAVKAIKA